jgi:TolB protein
MVIGSAMIALAAVVASQLLGKFDMSYPYPSSDGKRVVFQANFEGRWQLYAIDGSTGATSRIHTSAKDDTHPALSPDGKRIAFISNRGGNDDVYVLDIASGAARPVSPHPGKDGHPKWSADGQWLIFNRTFDPADKGGDNDSAIIRARPDGTGIQTISDTPRVETFPTFSPDGQRMVLVEWFPSAAGERNRNGELIVVDLASGTRRNITNSEAFDAYPYWGASGEWIYFSTIEADAAGQRRAVAYRIRPDGSVKQRLSEADGPSEVRAIPSQDESQLYFNVAGGGRTMIHRRPIPPAE